MGLFDIFKRKDEAIPKPGTPEFDAAVKGSTLPDAEGVEMGTQGWTSAAKPAGAGGGAEKAGAEAGQAGPAGASDDQVAKLQQMLGGQAEVQEGQTLDLRNVPELREKVVDVLKQHGVDPDNKNQEQIDASSVPGLQESMMNVLKEAGVQIPGIEGEQIPGMAAGLSGQQVSQADRLKQLDQLRDAGTISNTEYQEHRKRITGEG